MFYYDEEEDGDYNLVVEVPETLWAVHLDIINSVEISVHNS